MQIHVVAPGETVWELSGQYGVPFQEMVNVNSLNASDQLVVGQTLLIPTGTEQSERTIVVNGYVEPSPGLTENFYAAAAALTYVTLFSYEVSTEGTLTPLEDESFLNAVNNTNVSPLMAITNIQEGEFNLEAATAILTNDQTQNTLITNIIETISAKGYDGLNIDFEYLGAENREPFNQFLRNVTERLHNEGYSVSAALAPKVSAEQEGAWYEGHDYAAIGQIVDFSILMTYEWGWSGGPPMPVSPITEVREVIEFAVSVMDPNKIVMSIPLYGYDWTLPYEEGGEFANALNPVQAVNLAREKNVAISYDDEEEAPFFEYVDDEGQEHIVWFEDLRTMRAMFNLVDEFSLRGVSFWNLAFDYPQIWPYLLSRYEVKKV
jgi:spore germination protein